MFFKKMCSTNMQEIYRKTSMQKCDFSKLQTSFIEILLTRGCYCVNLFHIYLPYFSTQIRVKFGLLSNVLLTSSMFFSERAILRLPEFSLFLLRLVPCEQYFVTVCWIVVLLQIVNNNLGLCGLQTYFKKSYLTWGGFF